MELLIHRVRVTRQARQWPFHFPFAFHYFPPLLSERLSDPLVFCEWHLSLQAGLPHRRNPLWA